MDDLDRRILDLEARTFRSVGAKERAVRQLGVGWHAYHRALIRLAQDPEAHEYAPAVTRRVWDRLHGVTER